MSESQSYRLGKEISSLAALRGLHQSDLAERLGISQPLYSQKITGKKPWKPRELAALGLILEYPPLVERAAALGYPADDALREDVLRTEREKALAVLCAEVDALPLLQQRRFYYFAAMILSGMRDSSPSGGARQLLVLSQFDQEETVRGHGTYAYNG